MNKFEVLEHTADSRVKVFGRNREELFSNALLALSELALPELTERAVSIPFKVESTDIESLLVDFLNEAIYFSQTERSIYLKSIFKRISDSTAEGIFEGFKVRGFRNDIKAATYHGVKILEKEGIQEVIIIFDV